MSDLKQLDGCINTFSGLKFNLLEPTVAMVNIKDIARGLSYNAHFAGQIPQFFSIAQHSLMVCDLVYEANPDTLIDDPEILLLALLHDAAEAYIGDMVKPLKVHLPFFNEVEKKIMLAICEAFKLDYGRIGEIKKHDIKVQEIEYRTFFKGADLIHYQTPDEALKSFNERYEDLFNSHINKHG